MAFHVNDALRDHMLVTGSFKSAMDGGFIYIYQGTPPESANVGLDGSENLLCKISVDDLDVGLTFKATAAQGQIEKNDSEIWKGNITSSGEANFYRHVTGTFIMQGDVAQSGAEMNLADISLVATGTQNINHYLVTIPTPG